MKGRSSLSRGGKAACVVVFDNRGRILAVERPGSGGKKLGLPGGIVERGETTEVAVGREAAEEAGIVLVDPKVVYEHTDGSRDVTCYVSSFLGRPWSAEGLAVGWVEPAVLTDGGRCPFATWNRGLFASMRKQGYRV